MGVKFFLVDVNGKKTPLPKSIPILIYTGNTEDRADAFYWLSVYIPFNLSIYVPYKIKSSGRAFNHLTRAVQFVQSATLDPSKLSSFDGWSRLWWRASNTHAAHYYDGCVGDMLHPAFGQVGFPCESKNKAFFEVDNKGYALLYKGPYPNLYNHFYKKSINALSQGEPTYNFGGTISTGFPQVIADYLAGHTLREVFFERVDHAFTKGWGEDSEPGKANLYCVSPILFSVLFSLTQVAQILHELEGGVVNGLEKSLCAASDAKPKLSSDDDGGKAIKDVLASFLYTWNYFPSTIGLANLLTITGLFDERCWVKDKPPEQNEMDAAEAEVEASTSTSISALALADSKFSLPVLKQSATDFLGAQFRFFKHGREDERKSRLHPLERINVR